MIHISRSKKNKQFFVTSRSSNGNKLATSETLKRKNSAWKNIVAQVNLFDAGYALVQDNTLKTGPVVYKVYGEGSRIKSNAKPEKPITVK